MKIFPVGGTAYRYADRGGMGVEIFAPAGTPVLAVEDGQVQAKRDPKLGFVVTLTARSGTYVYQRLGKLSESTRDMFQHSVRVGEDIGVIGAAALTFQMQPAGRSLAVNPFPHLVRVDKLKRGQASSSSSSGGGFGKLLLLWAILKGF